MINFDQLYARTPYNSLDGTEILLLQKAGVTGGSVLNTLKSFFKSGFVANDVTNATSLGKSVMTVANLAAAKTLLEIPTLPVPAAPMHLSANTALDETHVNRRLFVDTGGITITLDASATLDTDYIHIINCASTSITVNAGSGEDIYYSGSGSVVTTYNVAAYSVFKAYLKDSNTWFCEV